jgi:glycosyltransferase involved in cell wall biosynthesis
MVKLLIIGQTPPPYVGQMLAIESLVKAQYRDIRVYHMRLNYSQTTVQIGKASIRKVFHLIRVIIESSYKILRHKIDVIYYPPGADLVPLLRDIATLLVLRRFRRKLILVFHASGLCDRVSSWRGILFWLFKKAFFFPDAAIQKSSLNPPDGAFIKAKAIYTVPNGCPDQFERFRQQRVRNDVPVILFVGLIREDKGVEVLLEAARILKTQGKKFRIKMIGEFTSAEYRDELSSKVSKKGLEDCLEFCGRKIGDEKWAHYLGADVFCFPSHYVFESFGIVLLEAMMFELPVVSTAWRGIPSVVEDGVTGFLTGIKDPAAVASRLDRLLDNEQLRLEMGQAGRRRYLENFTIEMYVQNTSAVVLEVANKKPDEIKSRDVRGVAAEI